MSTPELVIDSVTGVEVHLPVAGPGARSYAFLADWHARTLVAAGWYVAAALIHNGRFNLAAPLDPSSTWFALVLAPALAIYFLYHFVLEIALRGRTPGMRLAGIRIITRDGAAPGAGALLIRNVFRLVDCLPVFYGVGLIATMCTREHVRVGDMAAGTLLVYDRSDTLLSTAGQHEDTSGSGLNAHAALWRGAAERSRRLGEASGADLADALRLPQDYQLLAHELARARRLIPQSRTRGLLEVAYAQAHAALHRGPSYLGVALVRLLRDEVPAVTLRLTPHILWSSTVFLLTLAAGYQAVRTDPDLIALFASPQLIASVERGQLWTEGLLNVVPSCILSLQILTNNIFVSLSAYCAGFLFGLGTLYILGLNGLMLGAIFAFTSLHGLGAALLRFIVPHGLVELSVLCLSGAAGAAVGEALMRPSCASRMESFRRAAQESGKLIAACVLLLVGCGFIEGYLSPEPWFPLWARLAVGAGYWVFMVALLRGWLFRGRGAGGYASDAPRAT